MLRNITILANAALLAFSLWLFRTKGLPSGTDDMAIAFLLTAVPVLNLFFIWKAKAEASESILGLFLQRTRLEQKNKLETLKRQQQMR